MSTQSHQRALILASGSPYRKMLLERLQLPFDVESPGVDEEPLPDEAPADLARRLAAAKARAVSARFPSAVVIGSDQVARRGSAILGKPGSFERAVEQLESVNGRTVEFFSAFCVLCVQTGFEVTRSVTTEVRFRSLSRAEISRYVRQDMPLDCAGGFKSETSGITLLDWMHSDDPTAIVGLPLIALSRILREVGYRLP